MIEVKELTKYYGDKPGVMNISFRIETGEAVGLLGPNGAGKTTIMKMLASQMLPSSGSITVEGIDAIANPKESARCIGFLPEIPPLYPDMEVDSYLQFFAEVKGVQLKGRAAHIRKIMEMTSIGHVKGRLIRNLSKGYRQRVGLAQALIGFPPVLILDEPTVGLDPKQITEVRNLIESLAKDHTVILSSHILPEVKAICKRILIVNGGQLILEDSVENLEQGGKTFTIRVRGSLEQVEEILSGTPDVSEIKPVDNEAGELAGYCRFVVTGKAGNAVREEIFRRLAAQNMPIVELRTMGNSLEDIFLEVTA
jgi:ABC-2 type transport system ATP-binding protein